MKHSAFRLGALAAALIVAHGPVHATNGIFMPGFGVSAHGMGGVGVAYGRDSLSAAANPANLINVGMRGDMGMSIFNAERSAATGYSAGLTTVSRFGFDGHAESEGRMYVMPEMGMSMPLTENLSVGMAFVPLGGGGTNYAYNFFSYFSGGEDNPGTNVPVGLELIILQAPVSIAYRVNEDHTIGASLAINIARFHAFGLSSFSVFDTSATGGVTTITAYPDNLSDKGYDYSYGAGIHLGWQGEFLDDRLTLGLVYKSRGYMTKLDSYKGLFAEQGDLDIPSSYGFGIAFKPVKNLVIAADVLRTNYSEVASFGNLGPGTFLTGAGNGPLTGLPSHLDTSKELGNDDGMGFGFEDQTVYKLGVQYGVNERLQVRLGYNYGKSPASDNQLTFVSLAPAITEKHYTVGFSYKASEELEIGGMYLHAPSVLQETPIRQNVVGEANAQMEQHVFGVSLSWILDPGKSEYGDTPVSPDPWGVYAGFGVGNNWNNDWDSSRLNTLVADAGYTGTSEEDNSNIANIAWKFYGGYKFNKYWAVEGGYVNLIDNTANVDVTAPTAGSMRLSQQSNTWMLSAVGSYPITQNISIIGKLGLNRWNNKIKAIDNGIASLLGNLDPEGALGKGLGDIVFESDKTGVDPYFGIGVDFALADNFSLRLEAERFDVDGQNRDALTGGFTFTF
jgi:long-chain fatty acid transport protein